MSTQRNRKSKQRQPKQPLSVARPKEILLDECFLLCASGVGCDSTQCHDEAEADERKFSALLALLMARKKAILLVLDEDNQVAGFYRDKYKYLSRDVPEILMEWLNKRTTKRKPAKINQKAIKDCNLKTDKLDPILCQLAVACRGQAPIWTLDSDFWCATEFHPEIRPTCPKEAMESVT